MHGKIHQDLKINAQKVSWLSNNFGIPGMLKLPEKKFPTIKKYITHREDQMLEKSHAALPFRHLQTINFYIYSIQYCR
jgi:hypothetical protein